MNSIGPLQGPTQGLKVSILALYWIAKSAINSIDPLQGLTPGLKVFISALYWIAKPAINSIGPLQGPPQNLKFLFWFFIGRFLLLFKKKRKIRRNDYSLSFVVTRLHLLYHSLSLVVISCYSSYDLLQLALICCQSMNYSFVFFL